MEKEGLYVGVALLLGFLMLMTFSGGFDGSVSLTGKVVDNETGCTEDWSCDDWTTCADDLQSRTCTDANSCETEESKPDESQACVVEETNETETCVEDWSCDEWTDCAEELQSRTCTDANECETEESKPDESQACVVEETNETETCVEDWSCDEWTDCAEELQSRTCTDANECETEESKPDESQACVVEETNETETCVEDWSCDSWGDCSGGSQSRDCTDGNDCGTEDDKPSASQSCDEDEDEVNPYVDNDDVVDDYVVPLPQEETPEAENNEETLENEDSEEYLDDANQLTGGVVGDDNEKCVGCVLDEKCYKVNKRKNDQYCLNETVIEWVAQKAINESCVKNFECLNNSCQTVNSECEGEACIEERICGEPGFMKKIFNWLRKFLNME